jgi:germination protein M
MSRRAANALTVGLLVGLLCLLSLTAPRWARLLRQEAPVEDDPLASEASDAGAIKRPEQGTEREASRTIGVRLYLEAPDRVGLVPEERQVAFSSDLSVQIKTVVEELVKGSTAGLLPPLAEGTRVLAVFVTARGVAYLSLSAEAAATGGGVRSELHSVYAVVDTITANFPAIRRVQILIGDRESPTLGGHVDISRPLLPDMTFIALPVAESPPPSAAASPAPGLASPAAPVPTASPRQTQAPPPPSPAPEGGHP